MNKDLVAHLRSRMSDIQFIPRKVSTQPTLIGFMECKYDTFQGNYFTWKSIGLHTEDRKSYWTSWAKAIMKSGEHIYANQPTPEFEKACCALFVEAMQRYYEKDKIASAPQKVEVATAPASVPGQKSITDKPVKEATPAEEPKPYLYEYVDKNGEVHSGWMVKGSAEQVGWKQMSDDGREKSVFVPAFYRRPPKRS